MPHVLTESNDCVAVLLYRFVNSTSGRRVVDALSIIVVPTQTKIVEYATLHCEFPVCERNAAPG
jgi:hypothetical protein